MCKNCDDGMATECWDDVRTALPDVNFDYTPLVRNVSISRTPDMFRTTPDKKEAGMTTNHEQYDVSRAFREALELDNVQTEVSRRMAIMADYGDDTWPDGTVFRFYRAFRDQRRPEPYRYAALKTRNRWYLTGQEGAALKGLTWREFLAWLIGHPTANVVSFDQISVSEGWADFMDARSKL